MRTDANLKSRHEPFEELQLAFYGGLARSKNIVNVLGMTLIVMGLMSVQWIHWADTSRLTMITLALWFMF
jgi:ammonia channel protein AmtB